MPTRVAGSKGSLPMKRPRELVGAYSFQAGGGGREGTDIDIANTKVKIFSSNCQRSKTKGHEQVMRFGTTSADGSTYLWLGAVATASGVYSPSLLLMLVFSSSVRLSPDASGPGRHSTGR